MKKTVQKTTKTGNRAKIQATAARARKPKGIEDGALCAFTVLKMTRSQDGAVPLARLRLSVTDGERSAIVEDVLRLQTGPHEHRICVFFESIGQISEAATRFRPNWGRVEKRRGYCIVRHKAGRVRVAAYVAPSAIEARVLLPDECRDIAALARAVLSAARGVQSDFGRFTKAEHAADAELASIEASAQRIIKAAGKAGDLLALKFKKAE